MPTPPAHTARCGSRSTIETISYEEAYGRSFDDMMRRVPDLTRIEQAIATTESEPIGIALRMMAAIVVISLGNA